MKSRVLWTIAEHPITGRTWFYDHSRKRDRDWLQVHQAVKARQDGYLDSSFHYTGEMLKRKVSMSFHSLITSPPRYLRDS